MLDTQVTDTQKSSNPIQNLTNQVNYTIGWLGRRKPGTMQFDGVTISLQDKNGNSIFSSPMATINPVKRAEFGLYFKFEGKKIIFVSFGDETLYAAKSLGLGIIPDIIVSNEMNKQSGLEEWIMLFQEYDKMQLNASPNNITKWTLIITVIVIVIIPSTIFLIGVVLRALGLQ